MFTKLLLCFFSIFSLAALAGPGDHGGNGGDPIAGEVAARGHYILQSLKTGDDRGLLSASQLARFEDALMKTRIVVVDTRLAKPISIVENGILKVCRADWNKAARLDVDLVRQVFRNYLEVIDVADKDDSVSKHLKANEIGYRKRALVNPECPDGKLESVRIAFNIAQSFAYLRSPIHVNGVNYDPTDDTSYRHYASARLCTTKTFRFAVQMGSFSKTLELRGGQSIVLSIPNGSVSAP